MPQNALDTTNEEVTNRVFTVPNVISFIRLCFIPLFCVLLFQGLDLWATLVFAVAAATDWIDGTVARATHSVSRIGQFLDPLVDRLLMITGVICLFLVGRLPLWIILIVIIRDLYMLLGASYLLSRWHVRVAVIFAGKVATTFLYVGFTAILLNWPLIAGLGWVDVSWLPMFNGDLYSWGFWFAYLGVILALATTVHYTAKGVQGIAAQHKKEKEGKPLDLWEG